MIHRPKILPMATFAWRKSSSIAKKKISELKKIDSLFVEKVGKNFSIWNARPKETSLSAGETPRRLVNWCCNKSATTISIAMKICINNLKRNFGTKCEWDERERESVNKLPFLLRNKMMLVSMNHLLLHMESKSRIDSCNLLVSSSSASRQSYPLRATQKIMAVTPKMIKQYMLISFIQSKIKVHFCHIYHWNRLRSLMVFPDFQLKTVTNNQTIKFAKLQRRYYSTSKFF